MDSSPEAARGDLELAPDALEALRAATRLLAGVALRSLDALAGAVTLPQFRILAVLADFGKARSAQVARVLGVDTATVARFADRMAAAGYIRRHDEPGDRAAPVLELSPSGEALVAQVTAWRDQELARIFRQLPLAERTILTHALRQLVEVAGEGYGTASPPGTRLAR